MSKLPTKLQSLIENVEAADNKFRPTDSMVMAKQRFHTAMKNRGLLSDSYGMLSVQDLEVMSGSRQIEKWIAGSATFLMWFLDSNYETVRMKSYAESALATIMEVLQSPMMEKILTAKDKLKAAELLLQLADAFPSKKKEITYLDKDVANMDDEKVRAEIRAARAAILAGSKKE